MEVAGGLRQSWVGDPRLGRFKSRDYEMDIFKALYSFWVIGLFISQKGRLRQGKARDFTLHPGALPLLQEGGWEW